MRAPDFEWDESKNAENMLKHGVSFLEAQQAFADEKRVILEDAVHSAQEPRYFCLGKVGDHVLTVRFTWRKGKIRVFGAAFWRKGQKRYEEENKIRR